MNLLINIPPTELISTYRRVKNILNGQDKIIFDSMTEITKGRRYQFIAPTIRNEFDRKHQEIERFFEYRGLLPGIDIAFQLMEKIYQEINYTGDLLGIDSSELLEEINFRIDQTSIVRLNSNSRWLIEWEIKMPIASVVYDVIRLEFFDRVWGEIVPKYVIEYICTGLLAYRQGFHATSIALLSIAFEATLYDVLASRGYSFKPGVPSVDIFPYCLATVGIDGEHYTLTFMNNMPKMPCDFLISTNGQQTIPIEIRRKINDRGNRTDLVILTPTALLDHWSNNVPTQLAQRRVNGLGEAIHICRDVELVLTSNDLPESLDEVIITLRNNLIHLSEDSLATLLPMIDPLVNITLGIFLQKPEMVYDLVVHLPDLINQLYLDLRRAGIFIQ